MKAIGDGLRRELEAIASAKGIDIRAAASSGHGVPFPHQPDIPHCRIWMRDAIRR